MDSIWLNQIDSIFSKETPDDYQIFLNIISIALFGKEDTVLSTLYKCVGLEGLGEIVNALSNQTITIPNKHDFKDTLITAMCYYLKEIKHMDWDSIKNEIKYNDVSSIKYGKQIAKMNAKIIEQLNSVLVASEGKKHE